LCYNKIVNLRRNEFLFGNSLKNLRKNSGSIQYRSRWAIEKQKFFLTKNEKKICIGNLLKERISD